MYKALKMPPVHEELFAITMIYLEAEANYIVSNDPQDQVLRGDEICVST